MSRINLTKPNEGDREDELHEEEKEEVDQHKQIT